MNKLEKAQMTLLKESLERADLLTSTQARTIAALEVALSESQKNHQSLQALVTDQQKHIQRLEGSHR